MNRRTFLHSLGLGTAAAMLGTTVLPRRLYAQDGPGRNFIFCYFNGGWDTLMSIDPRDPGVFTESRIAETRIQLAWDRLAGYPQDIIQPSGSNIEFGPVMGEFARHYDKTCVLRGVSMDTVTHEVGRRYFLTGKQPRGLAAAGC